METIEVILDELTITGLTEAMTTIAGNFFGFTIIAFFICLVFWQKNVVLYAVAVPVTIIYGLVLAADVTSASPLWVSGIAISVIGIYCLFKAVMMGFEWVSERKSKK